MGKDSIQHGRCSFIPPDDFEIVPEASPIITEIPESMRSVKGAQPPVSLTLKRQGETVQEEDESDFSGKLDLNAFSPSITLLTLPAQFNQDPLVYLQQADQELLKSLDKYHTDFCARAMVDSYHGAYDQSSFETNFTLFRLTISWLMGYELLVATLMITEEGVQQGWLDLKEFASSVVLQTQ